MTGALKLPFRILYVRCVASCLVDRSGDPYGLDKGYILGAKKGIYKAKTWYLGFILEGRRVIEASHPQKTP